ncbi:MAG: transposase [Lentisphaeria bacterium]|nr:MAG: transposase [Lentisphaeria bacterium]
MVGPVACNAPLFSRAALQYPGNPYDGHTLKSALQQASKILGFEPEMAICDLGYRGHNDEGRCDVQIVNRFRKRASRSLRRWWNRRSAIEPVIGHCKSEHRMNRNQLRGSLGDELNVIFAAAGFNIRKLMRAFALFLYQFFQACLDSMGLPIESRRFKKVWKRKSARRKEPFLKRFFLLASGFCISDYFKCFFDLFRKTQNSDAGIMIFL